METTFGHIEYLHLLWLVPAFALVQWHGFARQRSGLRRFASTHLIPWLTPSVSWTRQKVRTALVLVSTVLLVVALAGPRWGEREVQVLRRGVDVMVLLDVSRSMLADDCRPNRLEKAKQLIKDLLDASPGDRIGLICFAGKTTLACPLTPNYGWFRMALDDVDTRSAPRGGSDLAEAIRTAASKLGERPGNHKAILLITDGEDQDSDPQFAASYALEDHQIRTFAIGLGDGDIGRRIPVETDSGIEFIKEQDGGEHYSKMNAALLEGIAGTGGGGFAVPAGTADIDMAEFYERIVAKLSPEQYETEEKQRYIERYQWFAAAALLLLMIETMMTDRKKSAAPELAGGW